MSVKLSEAPTMRKGGALTARTSDSVLLGSLTTINGGNRAFKILFDRYYFLLYNKALRLLDCHFSAEEAVADVFMKVWCNRKTLQVSTQLRSYLYRAIRNRCIDYLREQQPKAHYALDQCPAFESGGISPEQELVQRELSSRLQKAVSELPPQGRVIFRLIRYEGLKYAETAELLGISVKTVESHMRRSLISLRRHFRDCMPV